MIYTKKCFNLLYHKDYAWISETDDTATKGIYAIGLSALACEALQDIQYFDINAVIGSALNANEPFGTIESIKQVSELIMPVSATIINILPVEIEDLQDRPEESPMLLVNDVNIKDFEKLMNKDEYDVYFDG